MNGEENLNSNLCLRLLKAMRNKNVSTKKKTDMIDYLERLKIDLDEMVYGKSMLLWADKIGDEEVIKYLE